RVVGLYGALFAVADDGETARIDAVPGENADDTSRTRCRELPVRIELKVLDRNVGRVALDPDRVGEGRQRCGEALDHAAGVGPQMSAAAGKENVGLDLDLDPEIRAAHDDEVVLHQIVHRVLDL